MDKYLDAIPFDQGTLRCRFGQEQEMIYVRLIKAKENLIWMPRDICHLNQSRDLKQEGRLKIYQRHVGFLKGL